MPGTDAPQRVTAEAGTGPGAVARWAPVALYAGAIFTLSAQSAFDYGPRILWKLVLDFDKVAHACEFGVLAWLLLRASASVPFSLLATALYGVSDEVHQYFVPGRSASPFDALADAFGAALACLIWVRRRGVKP